MLTEIAGSPFLAGSYPFMMSVDPTGQFAYETNSGPYNVSAFSIDSDTGELAEIFYLEFIARVTSHIPYKGPSGGD